MPSIIIASNRLPVSVKKVDGRLVFEQGLGGLATGLSDYTKRPGTKWIGWPGIPSDDLTKAERAAIVRELRVHRCYPVFLSRQQIDEYYNGYSNSVIWPLFHDLGLKPYPSKWWRGYQAVNSLFAEEILRLSKPGSAIWVHDYHLLLVPQLLRRAGRNDKIGFFLHIPFPQPQVLQQADEAKRLVRGMLGADLVGFHTRSYAAAFTANCGRLLGLASRQGQVLMGERPIHVGQFPMGIDYTRFAQATRLRSKRRELRALRRRYRRRKIIVTVDRLDPTKGLVERLKAYRLFLRQHPRWVGKVVMVMIIAPSRTDISEYQELRTQLERLLRDIDAEFATKKWKPIDSIFEAVPLDTVALYYRIAQVAFITPIRDGMNLVAKEFIASKRRNNGVLILSTTAGAAEELQDAILVNPHKIQTMVDGLAQALAMPKHELRDRARHMQEHIQEFTVQKWAESFVSILERPQTMGHRTRSVTPQINHQIATAYRQTKHRLLLLDYDGVLRRLARTPEAAVPTAQLTGLLRRLSQDPANEIVIVSGRSKADLLKWFGDLPVALAAEHGALFRRRGGKNWHRMSGSDRTWLPEVTRLFKQYAALTPGALVEQKEWSTAWHYRTASPYYSQKHLVALRRLLKPILARNHLALEEGHKVLEVRPASINKGRIVQEWAIHDHDFVLAAGDDATDEAMFGVLPPGAYSLKVGRGRTLANYRLGSVSDTLHLLERLSP